MDLLVDSPGYFCEELLKSGFLADVLSVEYKGSSELRLTACVKDDEEADEFPEEDGPETVCIIREIEALSVGSGIASSISGERGIISASESTGEESLFQLCVIE